jgi:hypothetical protein
MIPLLFSNPFKEKGFWFKGNIHAHTTNSDGALDPRQISFLYKANGYDFLFITDHGKTTDVKRLSEDFEDFLVLPGVELSVGSSEVGTKYHLVALNLRQVIQSDDPQSAIDEAIEEGAEVVIGHPYWSSLTVNDLIRYKGYLGIEIFNSTCHLSISKGYSTTHWDDLLARGRFAYGFAVDDAHWHFNPHRPVDACYSWIMVKAPSLTLRSLMNALRNGLFYSSSGPEIHDVDFQDGFIRLRSSPARVISFIANTALGERFTAQDKPICEAEYKMRGVERYIRIEVEDEIGRTAWTNPIVLKP